MVDLSIAKQHLNVEASYTDDDLYIDGLIKASTAVVGQQVQRPYDDLSDGDKAIYDQAVLLLIGTYYSQREDVIVGSIATPLPTGVKHLCHLIRTYK